MIGEYINGGLMLLILIATFWLLKSPQKNRKESEAPPTREEE